MSVLVVGISHRTAPVEVLERLALDSDGVGKLISDLAGCEHVTEATVLSTCNRLEVYADVDRFHGSVEEVSRLLCERSGDASGSMSGGAAELLPYLYVHYDDGAVSHLFHVASGLDSMVVGEGQILGQVRHSLRVGQEDGTIGQSLNVLFQQALRVGKRSHAETDIDRAAPSLVGAALGSVGTLTVDGTGDLTGQRVVVVGAGAMAALAVSTASRLGAATITVLNRTADNAARLAAEYGARALPLAALGESIAEADVLITCTGATGIVVDFDTVAAARTLEAGVDPAEVPVSPLSIIDLALPHDVDPSVAGLPGVNLIDLRRLADELKDTDAGREVVGVRRIVGEEVNAFLAARRQASVTPTVVALRSMATGVVDSEVARLMGRLPNLSEGQRAEVEHAVRRVADKLLHQPTTRVKELANETGAVSYAAALAELFALDPDAVEAVTRADGVVARDEETGGGSR